MSHFNQLSPPEAERLAFLLEEMGEAQQVIGKILRHGYESRDPTMPLAVSNRQLLETEIGDVLAAIRMAFDVKDLDEDTVEFRARSKVRRVLQWMHHQEAPVGTQP